MRFDNFLEKDAKLSKQLRVAEQPGITRTIAAVIAHSGDSWYWFVGLPIIWYFGDPFWKYWALFLFMAILITAVIVMILKFSIRRSRPEGDWGQIYRKTDPHSFPSGHAARGLLIGIVAFGLGPIWLGLILIIWGILVGVARIAMGVHFVFDVFAGWFTGIIIGLLCNQILPNFIQQLI